MTNGEGAGQSFGWIPFKDGAPARAATPVASPERYVSRRSFFRNAWLTSWGYFAASFGAATLAYLWPNLRAGFGGKITAGTVQDIKAANAAEHGCHRCGFGRNFDPSEGGGRKGAKPQSRWHMAPTRMIGYISWPVNMRYTILGIPIFPHGLLIAVGAVAGGSLHPA